jgi:hypothetical protein
MHLRSDLVAGLAGQEAAKLGGKLGLPAAAPAQAEAGGTQLPAAAS